MTIFDELRAAEDGEQPDKWTPINDGDELLGILRKIDEREDRHGRTYRIATLSREDGTLVNVSVTAVIRSEFEHQDVQPGDGVRLTYRGTGKSKSGATFKKFDVIVVHQSTPTEEPF